MTTEREARMALAALHPMGSRQLGSLIAEYGARQVWADVRSMGESTAWGRRARGIDIAALRAATKACGARFQIPGDEGWPERLDDLDRGLLAERGASPVGVWVRGTLPRGRAVGIVGARASSAYGEHAASHFAYDLAVAGRTIVSGMAFGIDAAAHRGTLTAGRPTVAVLANAVDTPYPAAHAGLLRQILQSGAALSEAPPGTAPRKAAFLARNRLIAALCDAVVIVEGAARSGARNTVAWAASLGRPVLAVPGPITSSLSTTPHRLIRDGEATLVASAAEVNALIGPLDGHAELPLRGPEVPLDRLRPPLVAVREAIGAREQVSSAELSQRTGLSVMECLAAAEELVELGWLVAAEPAGWRLPQR
ncbi:MAG: DNA-processing protein DprA [Arachnia sp.]